MNSKNKYFLILILLSVLKNKYFLILILLSVLIIILVPLFDYNVNNYNEGFKGRIKRHIIASQPEPKPAPAFEDPDPIENDPDLIEDTGPIVVDKPAALPGKFLFNDMFDFDLNNQLVKLQQFFFG